MPGRVFLDTNIFAYTFDPQSGKKRLISKEIISHALSSEKSIISYQVIQEFLNIATLKFKTPLNNQDSKRYLNKVLLPLCEIFPSQELFTLGLDLQSSLHYSFYDCMIIASAIKGKCRTLYTEDLNHGQSVQGVTIINPFK